jgi:alpha-glucosidase
MREAPVSWDETRVLSGLPGESIAVARRKGHDWYLGSITNWTARDVHLPLAFLGEGTYTARVCKDAADADRDPKHVVTEEKVVKGHGTLDLHLAPGAGCAIRFMRND